MMTVPISADARRKGKNFTRHEKCREQAEEHEAYVRFHQKRADALRAQSYCDNCWKVMDAAVARDKMWTAIQHDPPDEQEEYHLLNDRVQVLRTQPCHCGRREPVE